jgi:uncharacterized membrane protein YfcA
VDQGGLSAVDLTLAALAAVAAGAVNALAGGGTLITFPTLIALGLPPVAANVTNTLALAPGALGGLLAQRRELSGQEKRLARLTPVALLGGLVGGFLLLHTDETLFRRLVPWLILAAAAVLAVQEPLRALLLRRLPGPSPAPTTEGHHRDHSEGLAMVPVFAAAIYGGYFGAGLGVILLAALGLVLHDSLTRINATKQAIGFSANFAAAVLFGLDGPVHWPAALAMATGAIAGGTIGGHLAGRIRHATLRRVVVSIGLLVGLAYLVRD